MIRNNNLSYKLSMEECFGINEYLTYNTSFSFKKEFTLRNTGIHSLKVEVEYKFNSGKAIVTLKNMEHGTILKEDIFDTSKIKDIKDILGLYTFIFDFVGDTCIVKVNLLIEYDVNYFESVEEYLKIQLDLFRYKYTIGRNKELLDYIEFFDKNNTFSRVCACYILELLKGTVHFERAKSSLLNILSITTYHGLNVNLHVIRMKSKKKEDIEGFIKIILDKEKDLSITENALISLYLTVIDKRKPYNKLVLVTLNEKKVYDSICTGLKEIKEIPLF